MPVPQSLTHSPIDFVGNDVEALASHMRHCARAHGRWFSLRSHMQRVRALAAGRIVTMACVAVVLGIGLFAVA
ncbi:hypothetical protein QTI51_02600 [Variovorax sp. J22G73]|jgi:hypothetical protein|uniref:hypothetical protein n=1 Tax=unclassified Variovorax TaxID=663243 RepID=UPI000D5F00BD|nr:MULTISPECIES: hypothetical protein [unclassified Variovorax]MDM0004184.1 hypothetical protein [Variovorax sp. J22R203]MDM0096150.1 hypothetical protein [Variovorax sp. J22G73]